MYNFSYLICFVIKKEKQSQNPRSSKTFVSNQFRFPFNRNDYYNYIIAIITTTTADSHAQAISYHLRQFHMDTLIPIYT